MDLTTLNTIDTLVDYILHAADSLGLEAAIRQAGRVYHPPTADLWEAADKARRIKKSSDANV